MPKSRGDSIAETKTQLSMKARLLLSTQRSGSHFLKSLIDTHFQDVICSGEMLEQPVAGVRQSPVLSTHPEVPHFWPWYKIETTAGNIPEAPDKRIDAFETYLLKLTALTEPKDLVVDTKYNSINTLIGCRETDYSSQDFTDFLTNRKIPVLHLIRKNILRIIVSYKLARETGIWHRNSERAPGESLPKIRLHPKGVLLEIKFGLGLIQEYRNRFKGFAGYSEIIYEDLVQEHESSTMGASLQTLARFLDKPPVNNIPTPIPYKKTTPEDSSEVVENWDDVVRMLRSTEHEWMAQTPLLAAA
jgi:LPS sulfotransferase NodH